MSAAAKISAAPFRPTAEQRQAAEPTASVWVSANAGSGKTHVLVDRLIRLMLAGADPASVLCLTFTKAAAAEMATRLQTRLGGWSILDDAALREQLAALLPGPVPESLLPRARRLFTLALETPGGLKIQTIHAFCQNILHLFPVEAGLAPGFQVMDDKDTDLLRAGAVAAVQRDVARNPDGELAQSFARIEPYMNAEQFDGIVKSLIAEPSQSFDALEAQSPFAVLKAAAAALIGADPSQNCDQIEAAVMQLDETVLRRVIAAFGSYKKHRNHHIASELQAVIAASVPKQRLALLRAALFTKADLVRLGEFVSKQAREGHPDAHALLMQQAGALATLVETHDSHRLAELTASLWQVVLAIRTAYAQEKRLRGLHDFNDLIARTAALLAREQAAAWVLYKLDRGIDHILVDEAQDTNPLQWNIISALTDEFFGGEGAPRERPRTLFVVGDRKQSIFSFQGADAALFESVQSAYAARIRAAKAEFFDVNLSISYRSVSAVLDAVDTVFPQAALLRMGFRTAAADGVHQSHRKGQQGTVEIWPLVRPLEDAEPDYWGNPVDAPSPDAPRKRLAQQVADTVAGWIGKRLLLAENRPVRADDILILVQRRGAFFDGLIAELRRAGVPVAGADRLTLTENIAVLDLLALARAILLRSDDHSLACALKSPFVPQPLSENELFDLAHARGSETLWQRLQQSDSGACKSCAAYLNALQVLAQDAPVHLFFAAVLNASRQAMMARLGPEALDATDAFVDMAIDYGTRTNGSLAGFVAWFEANETTIKREMEKPSGTVRIMTVHGAKGLEANIVILPDAADGPSARHDGYVMTPSGLPVITASDLVQTESLRHFKELRRQREAEERLRLLYVAMTRARNELYIAGSLGKKKATVPKESWYAQIMAALDTPSRRAEFRAIPASEGDDPILRSGADHVTQDHAPGAEIQENGIPAWALAAPMTEQVQVRLAPAQLVSADGLASTNPAVLRGIALHRLLRQLPSWPDDRRAVLAHDLGRQLDLDASDITRALGFLSRPDLAPFYGADSEGEVTLMVAEGAELRELRVDRLAVTGDAVLVLDYKTGQGGERGAEYEAQMARYRDSLALAYPGKTIRAALLWTDSGKLDWLT